MKTLRPRPFASVVLGIAAVVAGNFSASAGLVYDVRATALDGVPLPSGLAKGGFPIAVNDTITFTVYAEVTGVPGNAGAEGFHTGSYSLLSTTQAGGTIGEFLGGKVLSGFAAASSNGGTPTDTNGDGINDRLGGQRTTAAQATAPFDVHVRSGPLSNFNGTAIPDGMEFALSTADFRILALGDFLSVNVAPSIFTSGISAARWSAFWVEDVADPASPYPLVGGGYRTLDQTSPNTRAIGVGVPFEVISETQQQIPEPSTFAMLFLCAAGIAGSRRLCRR